jgi:hypothetical protein
MKKIAANKNYRLIRLASAQQSLFMDTGKGGSVGMMSPGEICSPDHMCKVWIRYMRDNKPEEYNESIGDTGRTAGEEWAVVYDCVDNSILDECVLELDALRVPKSVRKEIARKLKAEG